MNNNNNFDNVDNMTNMSPEERERLKLVLKAQEYSSIGAGFNDGAKKDMGKVDIRFERHDKNEEYETSRAEAHTPELIDEEEQKKKKKDFIDGYTSRRCYEAGVAQFRHLARIKVMIDPQGYRNLKFFQPDFIPSYKGFKPNPVQIEFEIPPDIALKEIEKLIEVMNEPDVVKDFWRHLTSPKSTRYDTPFDAYTKMVLSTTFNNRRDVTKTTNPNYINLTPDLNYNEKSSDTYVGGEKFIPEESWFDKKIVEHVKISDLLSIFPPAEQLMIALMLGRIVLGKAGKVTTCGSQIDHTMRAMLVFIGKTPGLGKSEVMKYIIDALSIMGYNTATMFDPGAKFGWGKVVTKPLAYYDDLTPEKIVELLKSPLVKSIVTGNEVTTEDKYMPSITTTPECGIIACSNSHNPRDLYQLDSGILSRVYLPATHSMSGLKKAQKFLDDMFIDSPDLRIRSHWDLIAHKLDIYSEDRRHCRTLALWLLKCSADLFMKTIGLEKTGKKNSQFQKINPDTLEQTCKLVDNFFEIPCNPDFGKDVFNALVFAKNVIQLNDKSYVDSQIGSMYCKNQLNWNSIQLKTSLFALEKMISFKGHHNKIYLALLCNHPLIRNLGIDWKKVSSLEDISNQAIEIVKEKYPMSKNRLFSPKVLDYLLDGCRNSIDKIKSLCYYMFLFVNTLPNTDERVLPLLKILQDCQSYILNSINALDIPSIVKTIRKVSAKDSHQGTEMDEREMFKLLLGGILNSDGYAPTSDTAWSKNTCRTCEQEFPTNEAHHSLLKAILTLDIQHDFEKDLPKLNNEVYTFNAGIAEKDVKIPDSIITLMCNS